MDPDAVHSALDALNVLAADLGSYQRVLRQEIIRMDRMKDGETLRAIKQEVRRLGVLIDQVSRSARQLRQAALAGLDILMDAERSILALAQEIDTGRFSLPQPSSGGGPVRPPLKVPGFFRIPDDNLRFPRVLVPAWLQTVATTFFDGMQADGK